MVSNIKGLRVFPAALYVALPKLNIESAGIPRKYILRYFIAPVSKEDLVLSNDKTHIFVTSLKSIVNMPIIRHRTNAVNTARLTASLLPLPIV